MQDRTYEVIIGLLCVALALAGIYYLTADSPIWNDWKSDEQSATDRDSTASSGKQIDDRIPEGERASSNSRQDASARQSDQIVTKQAPGEEVDMRPPETPPEAGKELIDRIPETKD